MGNFADTVEDKTQNTTLTAIDNNITPKIEIALRSINAFSGGDATSVLANSERGEHIGITASFENVSERNNTLHLLNTDDETTYNFTDQVSELSVPGTYSDGQPHTFHKNAFRKVNLSLKVLKRFS